ncbi:hypothetical protein [Halobacillus litoralis]|uniref:DUF2577 domain-containing protein n=1 Tax=Halobacillus litoralis TaxID=45668 RepID=A0A410MCB4_9BACI|nr:hypothetical protein [Halobacillus litoralis]QAS52371.1 hypothetical protein HLI_09065 [Halobacillus litoralis]
MTRDPFKEVAKDLYNSNRQHASRTMQGLGGELGTMNERLDLKLDNFKEPISDYLLAEQLSQSSSLSKGDRVVVLLVNGGQDHVIISKVVAR